MPSPAMKYVEYLRINHKKVHTPFLFPVSGMVLVQVWCSGAEGT